MKSAVERLKEMFRLVEAEKKFLHWYNLEFLRDDQGNPVQFGMKCYVHPLIIKTSGGVPHNTIADGSLRAMVEDHFNRMNTQIETVFNEKDGQYWLKPEYQVRARS